MKHEEITTITYVKLEFFLTINYTSSLSTLCTNELHKNCASNYFTPLTYTTCVFQTVSPGLLLNSAAFIASPKQVLFWNFNPITWAA